jgi:hypothetical protein
LAESKIEKRITLAQWQRIGANSASNQGNRKVNSASEEPLKEVILSRSLASLLSLWCASEKERDTTYEDAGPQHLLSK